MLVTAQETDTGTVLTVSHARLDASVAEVFKGEVKEIIDSGARRLVVDLSQVEFMDSSGLGSLVGCMKHLGQSGAFELSKPTETVMKVLRLTRMNKVFTIHEAPG